MFLVEIYAKMNVEFKKEFKKKNKKNGVKKMPCLPIGIIKGKDGADGADGTDGVGIQSISLASTNGLYKTYRINLTNNTHYDFIIKDGEDGIVDLTTDTPSQILAKIKNVDGPGSGLDADLLDGHDSSYFAKKEDIENVSKHKLHSTMHLMKRNGIVAFDVIGWGGGVTMGFPNEWCTIFEAYTHVPVEFFPAEPLVGGFIYFDGLFDSHLRMRIRCKDGGGKRRGDIEAYWDGQEHNNFYGHITWITED